MVPQVPRPPADLAQAAIPTRHALSLQRLGLGVPQPAVTAAGVYPHASPPVAFNAELFLLRQASRSGPIPSVGISSRITSPARSPQLRHLKPHFGKQGRVPRQLSDDLSRNSRLSLAADGRGSRHVHEPDQPISPNPTRHCLLLLKGIGQKCRPEFARNWGVSPNSWFWRSMGFRPLLLHRGVSPADPGGDTDGGAVAGRGRVRGPVSGE